MKKPQDIEQLRAEILARHDALSPRLRQVAAYVLDHPSDVGLETLAVIAERCGVQASTIVRFAKSFGYDGASQMQRLFRDELINSAPSPSYAERIRQFNARTGDAESLSPYDLLQEFAASNVMALDNLKASVDPRALEQAVRLMVEAAAVYVVGLRRSFPVASYLAYALRHAGKPVHLIDGLAGMFAEQSAMMSERDVLFATSFRPYAGETADIVSRARGAGVPVIAISDSRVSPVAREADICFDVRDAEVRQFRSLTASLCLAQALVVGCAQQVERTEGSPAPRKRARRSRRNDGA